MNHQVPIWQDLTGIFNKNGTYNQEPYLHMKYFPLIWFFLYTWIRGMLDGECFFPCLLLYCICKLRLTERPNGFAMSLCLHGLGASSKVQQQDLSIFYPSAGPNWMLFVERVGRGKVLIKPCHVATCCWRIYIHLFTRYLALTAACTLQVLLAAGLDDHCRSLPIKLN